MITSPVNINNRKDLVFYVDSTSWRVPALLAIIFFILSIVFDRQFFYLHYYLLIVSVLSFLFSFRKYGILTDNHLILFFNSILRKKLIFNLDQIESIHPESKKGKGLAYVGFGGVKYTHDIESIMINFRSSLNAYEINKILGKKEKNILDRKVELTEDGMGLILYQSPKGGFRRFLNKISETINVLNIEEIDLESKNFDLLLERNTK